jgi:hypothetical protein
VDSTGLSDAVYASQIPVCPGAAFEDSMGGNPFLERKKLAAVDVDETPLHSKLSENRPLEFRQVRRKPEEKLVGALIDRHHDLG